MVQLGKIADELKLFAKIESPWISGDWESFAIRGIQSLFSVLGLIFGIAAILMASQTNSQLRDISELQRQIYKLQSDKEDLSRQIAATYSSGKQETESVKAEISTQLVEYRQQVDADMRRGNTEANNLLAASSTRLQELKEHISEAETRLAKVEDGQATLRRSLADQTPLGSTVAPTTAAADTSPVVPPPGPQPGLPATEKAVPTTERATASKSLAPYSVLRVTNNTAEISGPEGTIRLSKGKSFGDGIKVMKISSRNGEMRIVTDHGVLTGKAKD